MRQSALTYIKIVVALFSVTIIIVYSYYRSYDYLRGPRIEIFSPVNGSTLREPLVTIVGRARNASEVTLNDREISTDFEGNFKEELLLAPDYSILTLSVRDKFGRARSESLELIYLPREEVASSTAL